MRKLKFKLDRKSLETVYIAFIRPLLEYGDIIWDNWKQKYKKTKKQKKKTKKKNKQKKKKKKKKQKKTNLTKYKMRRSK